jgi:hypothetical protein
VLTATPMLTATALLLTAAAVRVLFLLTRCVLAALLPALLLAALVLAALLAALVLLILFLVHDRSPGVAFPAFMSTTEHLLRSDRFRRCGMFARDFEEGTRKSVLPAEPWHTDRDRCRPEAAGVGADGHHLQRAHRGGRRHSVLARL